MNIDWKLLRCQKDSILYAIDHYIPKKGMTAEKVAEDLQAIVHLIDNLQDKAVFEDGVDENEVFGENE